MTGALTSTRSSYDSLASTYLWIGGGVFVAVVLVIAYMLVRFRAGRTDRPPSRVHEATRLEAGYAVVLAIVAAGLLFVTFRAQGREDAITAAAARDQGALHVSVIGAQWQWRFRYAGSPVVEQSAPEGTAPELVVPVGRRVLFSGWSQDVLHDFWIPDLRFQRQVWPDHVEHWALVFPHPGSFVGVCAWFCGLYHQSMHFVAVALPSAQFDAWLARRRRASP